MLLYVVTAADQRSLYGRQRFILIVLPLWWQLNVYAFAARRWPGCPSGYVYYNPVVTVVVVVVTVMTLIVDCDCVTDAAPRFVVDCGTLPATDCNHRLPLICGPGRCVTVGGYYTSPFTWVYNVVTVTLLRYRLVGVTSTQPTHAGYGLPVAARCWNLPLPRGCCDCYRVGYPVDWLPRFPVAVTLRCLLRTFGYVVTNVVVTVDFPHGYVGTLTPYHSCRSVVVGRW